MNGTNMDTYDKRNRGQSINERAIVDEITTIVTRRFPDPSAVCLYWACATAHVIKQRTGRRTIIQAGTSQWPRINMADDDGVMSTHFSYMWEPDSPVTAQRLHEMRFPEMHVWAAIPGTGEIVDLTTQYLRTQCERRAGLPWTAPEPPPYIWTPDLPDGVRYRADMSAIRIAARYAATAGFYFEFDPCIFPR